jgi:SAM-dependent methyltransferase
MAIAVGLFIGALPLVGLHLALCVVAGRLFKLNLPKVYLAANISNPFIAPFLFGAEIQLGAWLRTGHIYTPSVLDQVRLKGLALDITIGSLLLGVVLAVAGGLLTYAVVRKTAEDERADQLIGAAAERYLPLGIGAWELARGKMQMDPVYTRILADGVLPDAGTIVDIGCGQGLMLALVATARARYAEGIWPGWPPPPRTADLVGLEPRARVAARARTALEHDARIETAGALDALLPPCRAVLLLDVLHMLRRDDQDRVLAVVHDALEPGGVLILREADAAGGARFMLVRLGNWLRGVAEGHLARKLEFDSAAGWDARLRARGFVTTRAASGGAAPLANFLIYARRGVTDRAVADGAGADASMHQ